jgi:hypothetical protein
MRLLDSTSYDSGVTLLRYEPIRVEAADQPMS